MPEKLRPDDAKNRVQSVAKAFSVLRCFDVSRPELTIAELSTRTELDRGTTFRLVHTLIDLGYLAEVPESRRFRLTLKCLELGYTVLAQGNYKTLAQPMLREMVPEVGDAASLGMLDGFDVVYVERVEAEHSPNMIHRRVGSRAGAYATALGHAILAYLPRDRQLASLEAGERVKLSEHTQVELQALLDRLDQVREQGYAVSDGENAYGLRTVAAPIFDTAGRPVAAVSITVRASRSALAPFCEAALPQVQRIAKDLTTAVRLSFGTVVGDVIA